MFLSRIFSKLTKANREGLERAPSDWECTGGDHPGRRSVAARWRPAEGSALARAVGRSAGFCDRHLPSEAFLAGLHLPSEAFLAGLAPTIPARQLERPKLSDLKAELRKGSAARVDQAVALILARLSEKDRKHFDQNRPTPQRMSEQMAQLAQSRQLAAQGIPEGARIDPSVLAQLQQDYNRRVQESLAQMQQPYRNIMADALTNAADRQRMTAEYERWVRNQPGIFRQHVPGRVPEQYVADPPAVTQEQSERDRARETSR